MTDEPNIGPVTNADRLALINDPALRDWYETMMADVNAEAEAYTAEVVSTMQAHEQGIIDAEPGVDSPATEPVVAPRMPPRRRIRRSKR